MPRHRQFLCGLVFSMLLALPAAAAEVGIQWMQDIESAKAVARQTGRLVLVHFWTPECVPCRTLDLNVFNQPSVGAAVESQFVPVKLNANENPGTAQGLGITRVPTDVVLTPDGQVVSMSVSPSTPSTYVAGLAQVARQYAGRPGAAYQNAAMAASQPSQFNPAYANLQFSAPPQAATPTPQPPVVNAGTVSPAASSSPYTWAATGGQSVYGTPSNTQTTASQPGSYVSSNQAPAPAAQVATNDRAYGSQAWPTASTAPPTAATTPPMTVQNSYAQAPPPALPSQGVNPYTAPPAVRTQPAIAPIAPSQQVAAAQPTMPTAPPDARRLPPGAPPLGFDGYCPVSMRGQWRWVPGDPKWGAIHRGRTYWFASQREQQQFLANPDYYSPALSGIDPVLALDHGQTVSGMREHALDYDNQFYLFSSEATLQQFTSSPARYAEQIRQAMAVQSGRIVR
jgi:YHS domain-containing protein/thiol-disulfide isomerase/thioredoxin